MLDLSRPLDPVEGLILYRDHEQADLVYYLPDEIGLATDADGAPNLLLQVFFPDQALRGDEDLAAAVGSILSLGARCLVSPDRLARAKRDLGNVRLVAPPWEDGTVSLLLLDALDLTPGTTDRLVLSVAGTRRPSLSDGSLAALFSARLDRRATALVAAALSGAAGSNTGVLYDLTYAAMRPEVDLRMSANLDACAEAIRAGLGVQVYYVGADVAATFAKMREEGTIQVDLVSMATDPETQRLVEEAVRDFYDVLMRELFRPALSPADVAGLPHGAPTVGAAPVRLSLAYSRGEHERVVTVDYRKRSAVRRTHNPAAHLRSLGALGGGSRLVQRIPLSVAWRETQVEVAAPGAFGDNGGGEPGLLGIEAILWRGRDAVLPAAQAREGGLRMPEAVAPLADLALARGDTAARRLSWASPPEEPPFYRWQARLTYAPQETVDSPAEIWTEPQVSTSADLDLFPPVLAPLRRVVLRLGAGHDTTHASVEADITARRPSGELLARRRLTVTPQQPTQEWAVRRGHAETVLLEAALTHRYTRGRHVSLPPQALPDPELIANTPFATTVELTPLLTGATDGLARVVLTATYDHPGTGFHVETSSELPAPAFTGEPVAVPVLRVGDLVAWTAVGVGTDGSTRPLGSGSSPGGTVVVVAGTDRKVTVEWLGGDLADEGLRWVRVTLRVRDTAGVTTATATVQWRDREPPAAQTVMLPAKGRAEYTVERRTAAGIATEPWRAVEGDVVVVTP